MATAIIHNRALMRNSGMLEYSFDGTHTVIDDGSTSGIWKIALTSSGNLDVLKRAKKVTIQGRGGGGASGAGNAYTRGSDGSDGTIEEITQDLAVGTYQITIGAKGNASYDAAGAGGGTTRFADLLAAAGGAGGAYLGAKEKTHTTLYSDYGKGGEGGSTTQYKGTTTTKSYLKGTYPIYSEPDDTSEVIGTMVSGTKYYCSNTIKRGPDGTAYWVLDQGGYVSWKDTSGSYTETVSDTRSWYGNYGKPGVVILSGKA